MAVPTPTVAAVLAASHRNSLPTAWPANRYAEASARDRRLERRMRLPTDVGNLPQVRIIPHLISDAAKHLDEIAALVVDIERVAQMLHRAARGSHGSWMMRPPVGRGGPQAEVREFGGWGEWWVAGLDEQLKD